MSTLVISNEREQALKRAKKYIPITLFCILFGWVYEMFSFGVYSNFMIYAFVFPFAGGMVFWLLIGTSRKKLHFNKVFIKCHSASIATFTVGFIFKGILDIYGTKSYLCNVYWIAGIILISIAVISAVISNQKAKIDEKGQV